MRAVWRLARTAVHVLHGLAIVITRWPRLDPAQRHARVAWWAGKQLRLLGVRQTVDGEFRPGGALLVANHVSWLDIVLIHSACPHARFVSKADVKHWPLVNQLTMAADTLYIERENKRDAVRVVHQMAAALAAGDTVAVFPEGTTGDGHALLPFHANLLQAAVTTGTPVQAVALRYSQPGHAVSPAVAWVGDVTLLQSLWSIAAADGLQAGVRVLPPQGSRHADRRALVAHVRDVIADALAAASRP
ncbi:MAG TPA: lysophospholipid acyltransferase family protein [Aquabacterium sp.]|nr:lysophospholipid acyltransferase family protein [Aquabacterium sp.]